MTAEKFEKLLNNTKSLTKEDYTNLVKLAEQYPYFQTAHILILQYAQKFGQKNQKALLEKSGVFITDRTFLFKRLRQPDLFWEEIKNISTTQEPVEEEKQEVINEPQNIEKEQKNTDEKLEEKTVSAEGNDLDEKKQPKKLSRQKIHNALIDDVFSKINHPKKQKSKTDAIQTDKISSKELTEDIYDKIAKIKSAKHSEKTIKSDKAEELKTVIRKKDNLNISANETSEKQLNAEIEKKEDQLKRTKEEIQKEYNKLNPVTPADKIIKKIPNKLKVKKELKETTDIKEIKEKIEKTSAEPTTKTLSAAERLVQKINSVKKTPQEQEKVNNLLEDKTDELQKEKKSDDLKQVQPDKKETKTAADSILERINKIKQNNADKDKLIDKFVQNEPRLNRNEEIDLEGNIAEESIKEKNPVVTELMANIYINQGYYDKAIEVFEKLILKNPEKKDYFAAKIEETKQMK